MNGKCVGLFFTFVIPHLCRPLDPLVGNPFVSETHWTTQMKDSGVVAPECIVVEPVDGTTGLWLDAYSSLGENSETTNGHRTEVYHEGCYA